MIIVRLLLLSLIIIIFSYNSAFADIFSDGVNAYKQGNYIKAERCFKTAIVSYPQNNNLRYYLAISLVQNKKLDEARYHYKYIINSAPNSDIVYWANIGLKMITNNSSNNNYLTKSKVVLPLESNSSVVIVNNVLVNGRYRANFILDTGATYTLISTALARKLGLDIYNAPRVNLMTGNGLISAPKLRLDSLEIDGLVARNIEIVVHDFTSHKNISGLLGLSFLQNFRVTLDKSNGQVVLEKN